MLVMAPKKTNVYVSKPATTVTGNNGTYTQIRFIVKGICGQKATGSSCSCVWELRILQIQVPKSELPLTKYELIKNDI